MMLMLYSCICREEEERLRAEREAAAAEARGPALRRRRGFEPPVRDHCLLDAADEPDQDGPVAVPVRPAVSATTRHNSHCLCSFLCPSLIKFSKSLFIIDQN